VLLTPRLAALAGGSTPVEGLVCPSDFRIDLERPFSNRADVMFLNSSLATGTHLQTILAHELAHVVACSERFSRNAASAGVPDQEDWLNEGIAHVVESLHGGDGSNLDQRIGDYLAAPHLSPLVVEDYYRSGLWRHPGCRGATFLFMRWCVDRFGSELLREVVRRPERGPEVLEAVTGVPFPEVFRRWTMSLSDAEDGPSRQPEIIRWHVDQKPPGLILRGTATCLLELTPAKQPGPGRITITGPPGAKLQITIRRD
jgi:hypothetical protein